MLDRFNITSWTFSGHYKLASSILFQKQMSFLLLQVELQLY